jgi:hypothetical protein
MTENTLRGIAIVAGIANTAHAVNRTFSKEQMNQLLALFDHHPGGDEDTEYAEPGKLVLWTYNAHYAAGNVQTAEAVSKTFTWVTLKVDPSLFD